MKFLLLIIFWFSLLVFFPTFSFAQEMNHQDELKKLLGDEDPSKFFSNQNSGDFQKNFVRKVTLPPSNNILIKSGTTITLTGSIDREYSTILVEGDLKIIDTGDSDFRVQKIIVGPTGSLTIGNEENPILNDKQVEISFVNNNDGEVGIFVFGNLWIHGAEVNPTFVGLDSFARKWEKRLSVDTELENWKREDTVVVTSLGDDLCNEINKISRIVGTDILLQTQLNCSHLGSDTENPITSHIALLSRNVKITSEDEVKRGSVNFFHGSNGYIKYAQFDKLGPKEVLGRYPIHFHHLKDTSRGIEVIGNSIINSDNRWITIHDSNGILVKNNVGYISQGHGFFLEDGTEFDNVFEKNIGIIVKRELIRPEGAPSVFWTMNPMNVYRDNVAVNAPYWGYFFDIPDSEVDLPNTNKQLNLRSLPSLEFDGNTAYNFGHGGMKVTRPLIEDNEIPSSKIIISNFTMVGSAIKSEKHFGVRITGSDVTISDSYLLNNKFGILLFGDNNKVIDTEIKMESFFKPDNEISGIVVGGANNWIEHSKISGYVSENENNAFDISVLDNEKIKRILSAKIINTTLLDPIPFHMGRPGNDNSYLEVHGFDAPFSKTKNLPENFILKKIGSDVIEERGEYNNLDFDAMIKLLHNSTLENQNNNDKTYSENYEKIKSELINSFKNKSIAWEQNNFTDEELLDAVEVLFESGLIEIEGIEQGYFKEIDFIIPQWIKKLIIFWSENSITDQEFLNAIKYVFESNLKSDLSY